jgi:hypothetical protein
VAAEVACLQQARQAAGGSWLKSRSCALGGGGNETRDARIKRQKKRMSLSIFLLCVKEEALRAADQLQQIQSVATDRM